MSRQLFVAALLVLAVGLAAADGGYPSMDRTTDGSESIGMFDQRQPTPSSEILPKKTPPLPSAALHDASTPARVATSVHPTNDSNPPAPVGFGSSLGRAPPA